MVMIILYLPFGRWSLEVIFHLNGTFHVELVHYTFLVIVCARINGDMKSKRSKQASLNVSNTLCQFTLHIEQYSSLLVILQGWPNISET